VAGPRLEGGFVACVVVVVVMVVVVVRWVRERVRERVRKRVIGSWKLLACWKV